VTLTLARVVETCRACPAQWDARTVDGQYLYLRYRHGVGSVEKFPSPDPATWVEGDDTMLTEWQDPGGGGWISLPDFCARAGLTFAPDAEVVPWGEYVRGGRER
jgi:hypothetical protein